MAAIVHDIGIKISEIKYSSSSGKYQQIEGPVVAEELLRKLDYNNSIILRTCFLIAHHHTYSSIDDIDFQILVEADFLVNINEEKLSIETIKKIKEKIFKTKTGKLYLEHLYLE